MNTYILCGVAIKNANYKDLKEKENMQFKLDVFLLNDRIIQTEYEELVELLNGKLVS